MKKPKLRNFIFKKNKGFKSFLEHLEKYNKQQQLREADKQLLKEHNIMQNCDITPRYRDYPKATKIKNDGTIIYKINRSFDKKVRHNPSIREVIRDI